MSTHTVLVSCGEASGDLLASGVVRALKAADPALRVIGIAGAHSREAGAETQWDVSELSVMGIGEVLPKLRHILRLMDALVALAERERPEVAVLVDAPDFNLRIAKRLKKLGIRVVYYVSPSVWAWRSGRVKTIRKVVDEMCCILPFEEAWYRERGVVARFVGHPLLELLPAPEGPKALRAELLGKGSGPLLAILPGSRRMEINNLLPAMLGAARRLAKDQPGLEVVLPRAPTIPRELIDRHCDEAGFAVRVIDGRANELLAAADAAIVASGTAALEAALAECPSVVCYRASWLTYWTYRLFVNAPHVALPNIIAGREIVPEIMQHAVSAEALAGRVGPLLVDGADRRAMKQALSGLKASLGEPGASARVAGIALGRLLPAPTR